jgi:hypothetical protein
MAENEITAEGVTQEIAAEGADVQIEVKQEIDPKEAELQRLRAELQTAQDKVAEEQRVRLGHEKSNSKLARQFEDLTQRVEILTKTMDLSTKRSTGAIDDTEYNSRVSQIAAEHQSRQTKQAYEQQGIEALEAMKEAFEDAGIDPNSQDAAGVKEAFNHAVQTGSGFTSVVRMAEKLARDKVKAKVPSREDIEKEVKAQYLEDQKRNLARVSTATPNSVSSGLSDLKGKYARGEITSERYTEELKKYN